VAFKSSFMSRIDAKPSKLLVYDTQSSTGVHW